MHRYQPRLHVIRATSFHAIQPDLISTFSFVSTMFVTVTAYQNIEVSGDQVAFKTYKPNYTFVAFRLSI